MYIDAAKADPLRLDMANAATIPLEYAAQPWSTARLGFAHRVSSLNRRPLSVESALYSRRPMAPTALLANPVSDTYIVEGKTACHPNSTWEHVTFDKSSVRTRAGIAAQFP